MATSVEQILNQALRRIGYDQPIGTIWEGSKAARAGLEIYGQTRDDLLRKKDWPFARRDVVLTLNGQTAPPPWLYEFTYPSDCLRIRNVAASPIPGYPDLDPRPVQFTDFNEQRTSPPTKAILTNVSPAVLIYTGQITDMTTWDANFTEALVAALAERLALPIAGDVNVLGAEAQTAGMATGAALAAQANQAPTLDVPTTERRK
jgi:hypothetical protein